MTNKIIKRNKEILLNVYWLRVKRYKTVEVLEVYDAGVVEVAQRRRVQPPTVPSARQRHSLQSCRKVDPGTQLVCTNNHTITQTSK